MLTKLNQFAIENGISFDVSTVSQKIEELIALSKQVNGRGEESETQGKIEGE